MFPKEIILEVTKYLGNEKITQLLACNKDTFSIAGSVVFPDEHVFKARDLNKWWYNGIKKARFLGMDCEDFSWPKQISHIILDGTEEAVFPDTVTVLEYCGSGSLNKLPTRCVNLKKLTLDSELGMKCITCLPDSLEVLKINSCYDDDFTITLPTRLKKLCLKGGYNQPLELPDSLRKLSICGEFNHPLTLPANLEYLKLKGIFNQPLILNHGIKRVCISGNFDQPLYFPDSLEYLELRGRNTYLAPLPNLKVLKLDTEFDASFKVPETIECLTLGDSFTSPIEIPKKIAVLMFGRGYEKKVNLQRHVFLKCLTINRHLMKNGSTFPKNLLVLKIINYDILETTIDQENKLEKLAMCVK